MGQHGSRVGVSLKDVARGAIGAHLAVLVSSRLYGTARCQEYFTSLAGSPIKKPGRRDALPNPEFLRWHSKEVFRDPPRS
jgi:hypothetical protein